MHDEVALRLQDDLTSAITRYNARTTSGRGDGGSFIARVISSLSSMANIDATTVIAAGAPARPLRYRARVSMEGVKTALNVETEWRCCEVIKGRSR
jgi:rsbT antagonist protein RsbS